MVTPVFVTDGLAFNIPFDNLSPISVLLSFDHHYSYAPRLPYKWFPENTPHHLIT